MRVRRTRPNGQTAEAAEAVDISRIWGGIAWPGDRPGYCCVVGERKLPECLPDRTYYPLYLLAEYQATGNSKIELLESAVDLGRQFKISQWYGRGFNDKENNDFLRSWNRNERDRSDPDFRIRSATNTDTPSLEYQIGVLSGCLQDGALVLHWTLQSVFSAELISTPRETEKITSKSFPAVAAVGYVVSQFRDNPPRNRGLRKPTGIVQRSQSGY